MASQPVGEMEGEKAGEMMAPILDAIIIGAGMAGLVAARILHRAGCTVQVVESRDRVGGRLLTATSGAGHPIDLGATWFWPGEVRVAALIQELGLGVHPQYLDGDALFHDASGGQRLSGNPIDGPSGRFTDGAEALARGLAAQLPGGILRLSTAAEAIEVIDAVEPVEPLDPVEARTEAGVGPRALRVTTAAGPIVARHVVVALPPALAIARLRFDPALPDRMVGLATATPVWMANVAKVVAVYDRAFWRDRGLAGAAISHLGPMGEIHDMSGPGGDPAALFGFARLASPDQPAPDRAAIEAQLLALFGPDTPAPSEVLIVDWRRQPDTVAPGSASSPAYQLFGHPLYEEAALGGRLHWASTETTTISPGHIEGAMASGERAAGAIMAAMAPSTPARSKR